MHRPPRFEITATQIDQVVAAFYTDIRDHAVLGPVFAVRLGASANDWLAHEAKIARFWRNAILFERGYSGSPMVVHSATRQVQPPHFALWLDLFSQTVHRLLPKHTAEAFDALARKIGAGLRIGLQHSRSKLGAVPILK